MKVAHIDPQFWRGKRVFLTGHTGFKGSWLSLWLSSMGARITGYSLRPNTVQNLYDVLSISSLIEKCYIADVCDLILLKKAMYDACPDIIIHMAAQSLVINSYVNPVETYATNVMGTVNVLEAARGIDSLGATVIVTSDKCYQNNEWVWGYRENDPMGGYDPYSSSKGCAELVVSAYRQSFFSSPSIVNKVASARAGNVIGGGDWSPNRLIPDVIKSIESGRPLVLRNPHATRPWQHVLEPLSGYIILAQALYERNQPFAAGWNFGPSNEDNRSVEEVVELIISAWGSSEPLYLQDKESIHEASFLRLDCSKAQTQLGWTPKWGLEKAIEKIVQWHKSFQGNESMQEVTLGQIYEYQAIK